MGNCMVLKSVFSFVQICMTLARFILHRLSFTVEESVPAFQVKLSANELNCVDVLLNSTHSLTLVYSNYK